MTTKVISAFPGTGKTYFCKRNKEAIDLDSNTYTSGHTADGKVRNPDFPNNYLSAIEAQLGQHPLVLISPHIEVTTALLKKNIKVTFIYPDRKLKSEYIERFRQRGSSEAFIRLLDKYWDDFFDQLEQQKGCEHVILERGQYISDVLWESDEKERSSER